jgi:hypothetical protein
MTPVCSGIKTPVVDTHFDRDIKLLQVPTTNNNNQIDRLLMDDRRGVMGIPSACRPAWDTQSGWGVRNASSRPVFDISRKSWTGSSSKRPAKSKADGDDSRKSSSHENSRSFIKRAD